MTLRSSNYFQNYKEVLIPRIRENQSWADLFDAMSVAYAININYAIEQLRNLRNPSDQDRETNIRSARQLGFDYKSDLFTDLEYVNLVTFLNVFNNSVKGTDSFVQFIGWIKNAKFQAIQLWANGKEDYEEFNEYDSLVANNSKIDGTGDKSWYPTSHVQLMYDGREFKLDESDIRYLFYSTAPIHLVLDAIASVFTADTYLLFFSTSNSGDYSNTHNVYPAIYRYIAKLYMNTGFRSKTEDIGMPAKLAYDINNIYGEFTPISFTSSMDLKQLYDTNVIFIRNSEAIYYPKDSYVAEYAANNIPRLCYLPESPETHQVPLGIEIEPYAINYMLDSNHPTTRTVMLNNGYYTFSGVGTYNIVNVTTNTTLHTFNNGDSQFTFYLGAKSKVRVIPVGTTKESYFQLEAGQYKTSYILSGEFNNTRQADILYINRFPLPNFSELYLSIKFYEVKNLTATLLFFRKNAESYIQLVRTNLSKMSLQSYIDNELIIDKEIDYTEDLVFRINQNSIILNNVEYKYPLLNGIIPNLIYLGSENGLHAINGYIKEFNCFVF